MYWRSLKSILKIQIIILKEILKMTFTTNSSIAQSYAILILAGKITLERVPKVGNLREVVQELLTQ